MIVSEPLAFYQNVSTDKKLREASTSAEQRIRKFANEQSMREDLYRVKATAEANLRKTGAWDKLNAEQKRLVEKMLLEGQRDGLALEKKEDKERLKNLKDQLSDAVLKFTVGGCTFISVSAELMFIVEKLQRGECELASVSLNDLIEKTLCRVTLASRVRNWMVFQRM